MFKRLIVTMVLAAFFLPGCQSTERSTPTVTNDRPSPPQAGEKAPLFSLKKLDENVQVNLASFVDDRPVLLFFGSYT